MTRTECVDHRLISKSVSCKFKVALAALRKEIRDHGVRNKLSSSPGVLEDRHGFVGFHTQSHRAEVDTETCKSSTECWNLRIVTKGYLFTILTIFLTSML